MRYLFFIPFLIHSLLAVELANKPVLKGLAVATMPVDCVLQADGSAQIDLSTYIEHYSNGKRSYIFTSLNRGIEKAEVELEAFKRAFGRRNLLVKSSQLNVSDSVVFQANLYDGKKQAYVSARLYKKEELLILAVIESKSNSQRDFDDMRASFYKNFRLLDKDFNPLYDAYVPDELKLLEHKFERFKSSVLSEAVKEKDVAQKYKIPFPLPEVSLSKDEIKLKAKTLAETDADRLYPLGEKELKQIRSEAKEKYPFYKIGDTLTLKIQRGGVAPVVSGELKGFTQSGVRIGTRLISNLDLSKEQFSLFDPKLNEKYRKLYFNESLQNKRFKRFSFIKDQQKEYEQKLYKTSNYIFKKSKKRWISYQEYFLPYFKREKSTFLVKNLKKMKIDFYTSLGYGVLNDHSGARWKTLELTIPVHDFKNFSKPEFSFEDVTPIERKKLYDQNF